MTNSHGRPEQPEPFLRGCIWPAGAGMAYPRCDPGPLGLQLPADTRAAAAIPVGVRLELEGEPEHLEVDYATATDALGHRGPGAGTQLALYRGEACLDRVDARVGRHTVALSAGPGDGRLTLYLPEGMRPVVHAVRARGGEIRPAPRLPRWLCYGDSIVEGWCASEPALAWPHVVARRHGLDVVNLGYAGAARGEITSADEIARHAADVITIAHGTNCWSRTPQSVRRFAAGLCDFVTILRRGHPTIPIVAVSPILRPDAEERRNVLGSTLAELREAFEATVQELRASGDRALHLVEGVGIVEKDRLVDGIHPGDAGHEALARALGPRLVSALDATV